VDRRSVSFVAAGVVLASALFIATTVVIFSSPVGGCVVLPRVMPAWALAMTISESGYVTAGAVCLKRAASV